MKKLRWVFGIWTSLLGLALWSFAGDWVNYGLSNKQERAGIVACAIWIGTILVIWAFCEISTFKSRQLKQPR